MVEGLGKALDEAKGTLLPYSPREVLGLLISQIRVELVTERYNVLVPTSVGGRTKFSLAPTRILDWVRTNLIPDTVTLGLDQPDMVRLLVFSMAMPYRMASGQSLATQSELVRRSKRRDFQQIISDHFIGRMGEVAFKKFAFEKFGRKIALDWKIGQDLRSFETDFVGSRRRVDIKSTDTLEGIWAVAPNGADYGVFVKVCLPRDFFFKVLAHISSMKKLLDYARERADSSQDRSTVELVDYIEREAYDVKFQAKALVCGFFLAKDYAVTPAGTELAYLGEVEEEKYFVSRVTRLADFPPTMVRSSSLLVATGVGHSPLRRARGR